ncbi:unnamed protein product [Lactuca saligna]|uniref:Uncharacterized protein n=1 Tax=Lactuca saligna TaxID=75948 RepID=A0AA36A2Z5_LACSI|nr:unnamed protein product [Lactuca saligna]
MKKAKLGKTHTPSADVAPQDAGLEEDIDGIDVLEVDVKVEGEEGNITMERERWSKVWKFFQRLPIGFDGRERAQCDEELCLQELTDDIMEDASRNNKHESMEA